MCFKNTSLSQHLLERQVTFQIPNSRPYTIGTAFLMEKKRVIILDVFKFVFAGGVLSYI